MKMNIKKISIGCLLIIFTILLFSCGVKGSEEVDFGYFTSDDYLEVKKDKVYNQRDEEIHLRGTNAGGYLVIEQWMTAFTGDDNYYYYDHKKLTDTFIKRFGYEDTLLIWEAYRDNYFNEYDFIKCMEMGMNVIRLPFSYMSLDYNYNNVARCNDEYNFSLLDSFIKLAGEYGLYTILDMHGAYGSQNGQDHSGEAMQEADVDFYSNEEKMSKTIKLWKAISNRYKDDPRVAGYDLLNEPGEKAGITTTRHFELYKRLHDAIRENNDNHIIILESCWDGANLPRPDEYGYTNCMYSFHNYSNENDTDKNLISMKKKIDGAKKMNFNVPFYMGEFNCYGNEESWRETLKLFNNEGWHYTSWCYKLNLKNDGDYPGWGIFYTKAPLIRPNIDSLDVILRKLEKIDTAYEDSYEMRFNSQNTLFDLMQEFCGK